MSLFDTILDSYITENNIEVINEYTIVSFHDTYDVDMEKSSHFAGPGAAYFYVVDRKHKKKARIKFETPEYVYHTNTGGFTDLFLSSSEKKELIHVLKETPNKPTRLGKWCKTNWEFLIYERNYVNGISKDDIEKYMYGPIDKCRSDILSAFIPIPDYKLLSK